MTARNMTGARSLGEATEPRTQNVTTRSAQTKVTPEADNVTDGARGRWTA